MMQKCEHCEWWDDYRPSSITNRRGNCLYPYVPEWARSTIDTGRRLIEANQGKDCPTFKERVT